MPKDIQQQLALPDWDAPMAIAGYMSRLPPPPEDTQVAAVVQALHEVRVRRSAKRRMLLRQGVRSKFETPKEGVQVLISATLRSWLRVTRTCLHIST